MHQKNKVSLFYDFLKTFRDKDEYMKKTGKYERNTVVEGHHKISGGCFYTRSFSEFRGISVKK